MICTLAAASDLAFLPTDSKVVTPVGKQKGATPSLVYASPLYYQHSGDTLMCLNDLAFFVIQSALNYWDKSTSLTGLLFSPVPLCIPGQPLYTFIIIYTLYIRDH